MDPARGCRRAAGLRQHHKGLATADDDASTVVFGSVKANILETVPANFGQAGIYLWDRTVSP